MLDIINVELDSIIMDDRVMVIHNYGYFIDMTIMDKKFECLIVGNTQ